MKRIILILLLSSVVWGGCTPQARKAVVIQSDDEGITIISDGTVESYYSTIYFDLNKDPLISRELLRIYRKIEPAKDTADIFEKLCISFQSTLFYGTDQGDVFVPFLLTNDAVNMADAELTKKLSEVGIKAYIASFTGADKNYRFICLSQEKPGEDMYTGGKYASYNAPYYTFVQVWDDESIWAQPLYEGSGFGFMEAEGTQSTMLLQQEGRNDALISIGLAFDYGNTHDYNIAILGWEHKGDKWDIISWEDYFDVSVVNSKEEWYKQFPYYSNMTGYRIYPDGMYIFMTYSYDKYDMPVAYRQEHIWKINEDNSISIIAFETGEEFLRIIPK